MARTNVVVDDELVDRVKKLYGLPSTRAAIDLALRSLVGTGDPTDILDLKGSGWDGDLNEMRAGRLDRR